jgi:hypothetical protein
MTDLFCEISGYGGALPRFPDIVRILFRLSVAFSYDCRNRGGGGFGDPDKTNSQVVLDELHRRSGRNIFALSTFIFGPIRVKFEWADRVTLQGSAFSPNYRSASCRIPRIQRPGHVVPKHANLAVIGHQLADLAVDIVDEAVAQRAPSGWCRSISE